MCSAGLCDRDLVAGIDIDVRVLGIMLQTVQCGVREIVDIENSIALARALACGARSSV